MVAEAGSTAAAEEAGTVVGAELVAETILQSRGREMRPFFCTLFCTREKDDCRQNVGGDIISAGEQMSLGRHVRRDGRKAVWVQAILASIVLISVFAARGAPTHFADATSDRSISAESHHDQRPRFDHAGSGWSAPVAAVLLFPPSVGPSHLAPVGLPVPTLPTKGFRFNRPPPIS